MDKQGKVKPRVDQMWMCILIKGVKIDVALQSTLKWTRKESIQEMTKTKSGKPYVYTWPQLRKYGWHCVKVNLSFEI
ncbi:hypothetical protein SAMN04488101_101126 [Pedobacter nyackensis]|uniref:Uncharacterized protein n=1 Tax=Pedobacter nyackensis TaxID=475255 RepID=A0A1W1ZXI8_9SPHI|nr:hypothetical protein SAMN04488101_101126 [Pedobacter nyackensis]